MRGYDALLRDLERRIRANPRLTPQPTCAACGLQQPATAFTGDVCRHCATDRELAFLRMRLDEIERENQRPDGEPWWTPPRDEMVDEGPFLPEEDT